MSGIQTAQANRAEQQQQQARNEAAQARNKELERQQEEADLQAQEQKSDRARQTDAQIATMLAQQADTGATGAAIARLGGGFAGVGGLDIARIESNRRSGELSRHAEAISIVKETNFANKQSQARQRANTVSFFGDTALSAAKTGFDVTQIKENPVTKKKP